MGVRSDHVSQQRTPICRLARDLVDFGGDTANATLMVASALAPIVAATLLRNDRTEVDAKPFGG